MTKATIFRLIATALVLISLGLPLTRCSNGVAGQGATASAGAQVVESDEEDGYDYLYAKYWFDLTEWQGWLAILSFFWPLLMLVGRWRSSRIRESRSTPWVEVLLCLGSGYVIWTITSFGERLSGAYVVLSGIILYLLAAIRDVFRQNSRST